MIGAREGVRSQQILLSTEPVLFVEGELGDSFDAEVLRTLLDNRLTIQTLGPSYSVKSVAQALHPHHPDYYFLIDRDAHHSDEAVNASWNRFPDETKDNLLIWRRRELENYFLDPAYLICSRFCKASVPVVTDRLVSIVQQRLYMDVANNVLVSIRENQKSNWVRLFSNSDGFSSAEEALERLKKSTGFAKRLDDVRVSVDPSNLERLFSKFLIEMTGGQSELSVGTGRWLEMTQGKKVLAQLVNSNLFDVRDRKNIAVQGPEKLREVARDLLRQGAEISQPADFIELKRLIEDRVRAV